MINQSSQTCLKVIPCVSSLHDLYCASRILRRASANHPGPLRLSYGQPRQGASNLQLVHWHVCCLDMFGSQQHSLSLVRAHTITSHQTAQVQYSLQESLILRHVSGILWQSLVNHIITMDIYGLWPYVVVSVVKTTRRFIWAFKNWANSSARGPHSKGRDLPSSRVTHHWYLKFEQTMLQYVAMFLISRLYSSQCLVHPQPLNVIVCYCSWSNLHKFTKTFMQRVSKSSSLLFPLSLFLYGVPMP